MNAQSMTLAQLQREMARSVMMPLTQNEEMQRETPNGKSMEQVAASFIAPNSQLSAFERLEIYNRQYWFRLYSCFEEDFPGLMAIVGRKKFDALMRAYLTEIPSTSFSLRNLGSQLEGWLREHPEFLEPRTELALDMVRIEWAHIEAFDSAAEPLLDPDDLASVNEDSHLRMQPYLRLLKLHYPVDDLIIEVRSESGSSDSSSNNASAARKRRTVHRVAQMEPEEIYLAVHRHENSVYYKQLGREDYQLLSALIAGESIGTAIDSAFEGSAIPEDERVPFLQTAFQTWASLGWFIK